MRKILLASTILGLPVAAQAQGNVAINLDAPVTMSGGNSSLLLGFPWGGGNQQTLSGNGEGETYETSGVTQGPNGSLILTAKPNTNTSGAWPNNLPYVSGAISTASYANGEPHPGGFTALYGYFQMTAELPTGAGLWPAFWLEPVNGTSACEIDIFEAPFNNPSLIQDSLHDGGKGYTTGQVTVPNYSTTFNTYGVNWSPTTITYYVNGKVVGSTPTPASCNTPAYILANLAVGGQSWSWPGTPNGSTPFPANMTIQSITYNPKGPGGVGNDGGTFSGGLAGAGLPTATAAVVQAPADDPTAAITFPKDTGAAAPAATPAASNLTAGMNPDAGAGNTMTASTGTATPGVDPLTDCSGNTWAVNTSGQVTENGALVPGGGDTSNLTISGCTVYGQDNGKSDHDSPNLGGWFNLSSVDPSAGQAWTSMGTGTPPTASGAAPAAVAGTTAPATAVNGPGVNMSTISNPAPVVCGKMGTGGFHVAGGQIIGPDGNPWIARGVDVHASNLGVAAQQLPTQFPGINLVRVAAGDWGPLEDPSSFSAAVASLTGQGTVVEFSDYGNTVGGGGGSQGVVYTGATLATESAWFAAMATMYKNNPYVWLGTDNEPATKGGSLSDWQLATYKAIRDTGNTNPIFLEPSGDAAGNFRGGAGTPLQSGMNPGDYAGMTNVIWDPHIYGYQTNYSTDAATIASEIKAVVAAVQTIQSADGLVPAVIGEYGTDGANGMQTVSGVITAGANNVTGSAAWAWDSQGVVGGPSGDPTGSEHDDLLSGGQITTYGQMVQLYINTSVTPCSQAELSQQAQQEVTDTQTLLAGQ